MIFGAKEEIIPTYYDDDKPKSVQKTAFGLVWIILLWFSYDIGRYIAGVTFFHAVTGMDISKLTYAPDGVNEQVRKVAIESAINAVKKPYEVTPSQYV